MAGPGVCPLCGDVLNNGETTVPWWGQPIGRDVVHASCAQELRGEAEG